VSRDTKHVSRDTKHVSRDADFLSIESGFIEGEGDTDGGGHVLCVDFVQYIQSMCHVTLPFWGRTCALC
jgi:hypothetical protein